MAIPAFVSNLVKYFLISIINKMSFLNTIETLYFYSYFDKSSATDNKLQLNQGLAVQKEKKRGKFAALFFLNYI